MCITYIRKDARDRRVSSVRDVCICDENGLICVARERRGRQANRLSAWQGRNRTGKEEDEEEEEVRRDEAGRDETSGVRKRRRTGRARRREKQKYTLVMVQNRLELLELTTEQDAHLRLEDKHRHLYKLVDTLAKKYGV